MKISLILIATVLLMGIVISTCAAQGASVTVSHNVTISKADVFYKYMVFVIETKRISMEAVIEHAKELNKDTKNLTLYKNRLLELKDKLENAVKEKNMSKIRNITREMRETISKFRYEVKRIFGSNI